MNIIQSVKQFAVILTILVLFQNCSIYRAKEATIDEATTFPGKVKIKTTSEETFKFERLIKEDGNIVGVAKKNSKAVKKLVNKVVPESADNKFVKINLDNNFIDAIHLKNKTLSTGLGVLGVLYVIALVGAGLAILLVVGAFQKRVAKCSLIKYGDQKSLAEMQDFLIQKNDIFTVICYKSVV